jgi:hypothetical protein
MDGFPKAISVPRPQCENGRRPQPSRLEWVMQKYNFQLPGNLGPFSVNHPDKFPTTPQRGYTPISQPVCRQQVMIVWKLELQL